MESSGTISRAAIRKLSFSKTCATAGPDSSVRSPRAQESLTVTTAARKDSGVSTSAVEEDIFLLFPSTAAGMGNPGRRRSRRAIWRIAARRIAACAGLGAAVARGLVKQPQPLHQQALRIQLGS